MLVCSSDWTGKSPRPGVSVSAGHIGTVLGGFSPDLKATWASWVLRKSSWPAQQSREMQQPLVCGLLAGCVWCVCSVWGEQGDKGQALRGQREHGLGAASCKSLFFATLGIQTFFLREIDFTSRNYRLLLPWCIRKWAGMHKSTDSYSYTFYHIPLQWHNSGRDSTGAWKGMCVFSSLRIWGVSTKEFFIHLITHPKNLVYFAFMELLWVGCEFFPHFMFWCLHKPTRF